MSRGFFIDRSEKQDRTYLHTYVRRSDFFADSAFAGYERGFTFTTRDPMLIPPAVLRNTARNVMKPWRVVALNTMMVTYLWPGRCSGYGWK